MKAIILAAGMGTRLGKYTQDLPKCLLNFKGMSLIERQTKTLRACGITDISIVRGFQPERITIPGVKYYENIEFETTNMVATLMAAEAEFVGHEDGVIVCYADIIYEQRLVELLLQSPSHISVLVDDHWQAYWKARLDDWESDVESLTFDMNDRILEIGSPRCSLRDAQARYIGLLKFSTLGAQQFSQVYHENRDRYWTSERPWRKSKSFRRAYMTCMLQELIDRHIEVRAVHTSHGWMEFDTVDDYERAVSWAKDGTLHRFIDLRKTVD